METVTVSIETSLHFYNSLENNYKLGATVVWRTDSVGSSVVEQI